MGFFPGDIIGVFPITHNQVMVFWENIDASQIKRWGNSDEIKRNIGYDLMSVHQGIRDKDTRLLMTKVYETRRSGLFPLGNISERHKMWCALFTGNRFLYATTSGTVRGAQAWRPKTPDVGFLVDNQCIARLRRASNKQELRARLWKHPA